MKKKNRVIGIIGIGVYKGNFNADFEGYPRSNSQGFDASHASLKYPIRRYMERMGNTIYYKKRMILKGKNKAMNPMKALENYEYLFGEINKNTSRADIFKNLMSCADVHNFGVTFAEKGVSLPATGAVQITDGINIYKEASIDRTAVLSSFANSNKDDASQTTIGERKVLDEAHFVFGFGVNPIAYDDDIELIDGFEGYQEEMYQEFKKAALAGVTAQQSVAKIGCENEFALFVNFKEGVLYDLPNLYRLVEFYKDDEGKNVFDLSRVFEIIGTQKDFIDDVEIYYDNFGAKLEHTDIPDLKIIRKNIYNHKEIV